MKIVQINATCGSGSTGKICVDISRLLTDKNIENYIIYSGKKSTYPLGIYCGDSKEIKIQALRSHLFGLYGFNSIQITKRMLKKLDEIEPDVVHLHNLHGHNCNLKMLLDYLRAHHIKIFWTFHDCWAFTAYCPHFAMDKCDKWKDGCHDCHRYREYTFFFDRSRELYNKKKKASEGLDLTIVTPSQWLADLVKQSFFKNYPVKVINNGIDLGIFKTTPSDFRAKHGIPNDKYIVLGVAFGWGVRKGLDVFIELSKRLDKEKYQIILVGTDEKIDKQLPSNIISIHRIQNQKELAEIYTAADVFANPTREEVFGLVNVEALACGTPGVTFDAGGSPECYDETCGSVVPCDDIDAMEKEIIRICEDKPFSAGDCIKYAKNFNIQKKYREYLKLYGEIDE